MTRYPRLAPKNRLDRSQSTRNEWKIDFDRRPFPYCYVKNNSSTSNGWRAAVGGNMSGTHRCCLRLLSISRVHTDGSHPGKVTRWCATDLFIDRGFDLARGYRFRVVASWRVILSTIHNVSATNLRIDPFANSFCKSSVDFVTARCVCILYYALLQCCILRNCNVLYCYMYINILIVIIQYCIIYINIVLYRYCIIYITHIYIYCDNINILKM